MTELLQDLSQKETRILVRFPVIFLGWDCRVQRLDLHATESHWPVISVMNRPTTVDVNFTKICYETCMDVADKACIYFAADMQNWVELRLG